MARLQPTQWLDGLGRSQVRQRTGTDPVVAVVDVELAAATVQEFAYGAPQADDITLVVAKRV